ncbi:MAG: efflux RND transporter permease subunit [Flavobacteriaceae bacterium]|nr:efflux RND transporter permease subunit [Flavobacteriaceae bacterium]
MSFWTVVSRVILKGKYIILLLLVAITYFLVLQSKNIRFSHTEANLLPSNHEVNKTYDKFLEIFGEEGNLVILAVKDSAMLTAKTFNNWNKFAKKIDSFLEVEYTVSISDIKKLTKDKRNKKFIAKPLYEKKPKTDAEVKKITENLFTNLPFYNNLLFNKETGTIRTAVYIKKDIINTKIRKNFIINKLIPEIEAFEKENAVNVYVSGMPYVRTLNSQNIQNEMSFFVFAALGITALIFFFFFRSFRATLITLTVVTIGVIWAFGIIGWLGYEVSVLTALIPPLIIVIGVPNCVFLIHKYQQEIKNHGNQAKSLQRVISKIGNATLMTNLTTASGFATFIFTKSKVLNEFGIIASINIMAIFILSLLIIPIIYSFLPKPKEKHLKHLEKKWINNIVNWMVNTVKHQKISIYIVTFILIIVSIIGVYMIRVSGSLIEDMPKEEEFYKDIKFFEKEFGGIMALEILVDTKKPKGVMKLSTLKRMNKIEEVIDEIEELSPMLSILNLVKYSKQAYYKGNPKFFQLPTTGEKNYILSYVKNSNTNTNMLNSFVDSTGRYARMTTYMKDIGTDKMDRIEERLSAKVKKYFPKKNYEITMTGKALVFLKGTTYLVKNLTVSLGLAIILIALFMAWMFRSFKMILISLIPNVLPLLFTAGLMGYLGVPIKPSTILVFSIAFGISVDDTIHFLAKYRQELQANNWRVRKSVYNAIKETGVSMFYTSIVLFFGFLIFMFSSFGGTIALGGLVSITLLFAMVSNLVLLPALLLSFERKIANEKTFIEPKIKVLPKEE